MDVDLYFVESNAAIYTQIITWFCTQQRDRFSAAAELRVALFQFTSPLKISGEYRNSP